MTKLIIPIEPKPQTRPKFSKWGTYEDPKMKAWRKKCTYLVKNLWEHDRLIGPLEVGIIFFLPAPQAISKEPTQKAKEQTKQRYQNYLSEKIPHDKRPDLDNYIKAVLDSVGDAGNVWIDDGQICSIKAKKVYSPNPRIEMEIIGFEEHKNSRTDKAN